MSTKDELETKLYEKMSQENEAFLAEMKTQSPDEIISHAYEIACRDNLLMLFEDETSLSEQQLAVLNEFERPLSQLYTDWLSRDTDEMDAFRDTYPRHRFFPRTLPRSLYPRRWQHRCWLGRHDGLLRST